MSESGQTGDMLNGVEELAGNMDIPNTKMSDVRIRRYVRDAAWHSCSRHHGYLTCANFFVQFLYLVCNKEIAQIKDAL